MCSLFVLIGLFQSCHLVISRRHHLVACVFVSPFILNLLLPVCLKVRVHDGWDSRPVDCVRDTFPYTPRCKKTWKIQMYSNVIQVFRLFTRHNLIKKLHMKSENSEVCDSIVYSHLSKQVIYIVSNSLVFAIRIDGLYCMSIFLIRFYLSCHVYSMLYL